MGGLEEPFFAFVELGEAAVEVGGRFLDEGGDDVLVFGGGADGEGFGGVFEAVEEVGAVVEGSLDEGDGGGGAFLARVMEGGFDEILDGEVGVGSGGDDEGVFAGGLGGEVEVGSPAEEHVGGVRGAGEDDGGDAFVGDEFFSEFVVGGGEKLEGVFGDAGAVEAVDHELGGGDGFGGGFDDDGVAADKSREDAAAGDGTGEVPGRGDEDGAARGVAEAVLPGGGGEGVGVVVGEVDGFGDFDVGFLRGFVGLVVHDVDEVEAGGGEFVGGFAEEVGAFGEWGVFPGGGVGELEGGFDVVFCDGGVLGTRPEVTFTVVGRLGTRPEVMFTC